MIKKIGKGQTVLCQRCQKPLMLNVAKSGGNGVTCEQGCTQIELEVEL